MPRERDLMSLQCVGWAKAHCAVPTISARSAVWKVGTLRFAHLTQWIARSRLRQGFDEAVHSGLAGAFSEGGEPGTMVKTQCSRLVLRRADIAQEGIDVRAQPLGFAAQCRRRIQDLRC